MADLVLYTTRNLTLEELSHFRQMRSITVKLFVNSGFQSGAIQALKDGFGHKGVEEKWFDEYDWVIRLNPDVLILDDKWLLEIMRNSSIDGIFQDCTVCLLHTDFFAVRPRAVNSILVDKSKNGNAELHATKSFENIVRSRRFVWVKGGFPEHYAICRIQGGRSPVLHHHQLDQFCAKGANYFQHGFNLSMTMERQQPLENRDCKPAFIDNDRV